MDDQHACGYPLRYTVSNHVLILPTDPLNSTVDAMLETGYDEEFCIADSFKPCFIARLMLAGFLVMSTAFYDEAENKDSFLVLPKLHRVRSALFFENLHVKKSIRKYLPRYELRIDSDFDTIVDHCIRMHGDGWLTPPLIKSIRFIRKRATSLADCLARIEAAAGDKERDTVPQPMELPWRKMPLYLRPVSFGVYRDGELKAGEFGIIQGRVYTSYSGYFDEENAGTVQLILMTQFLQSAHFDFLDFGMPLPYKYDLGAQDIEPPRFVRLFRNAQIG
ncbi:GNAT family N-acetyltransferase [Breznakiellaceae bacterium SP9]